MSGRRRVASLAGELSTKDLALLRLLEASRFATTRQLASFTQEGHSSWASALRQTSRALQSLTGHGVVVSLERRIGGRRAGSTGLIWALTPAGHRLLDTITERPAGKRYRSETEPSSTFLNHTLAITETRLRLHQLGATTTIRLAVFDHEPASWRRYLAPHGGTTTLKPDAYAVITSPDYEDHYFLEIDCNTEALVIIERKALQYQAYRRTVTEQARIGLFPAVVWVTPTEHRAERIRERLARTPGLSPGLFTAISIDQLAEHVHTGPASP
ncbi:replication-relaxation family protein [Arthrobacter woluwensis]|uniref:replication-relaxation family protein n=1 Tax=Arthrobacter woluwensis TaxID=156980 RepID=UPI0011A164D4|nr:replication-relaxation family protein [Arthrobacter woluwensis]